MPAIPAIRTGQLSLERLLDIQVIEICPRPPGDQLGPGEEGEVVARLRPTPGALERGEVKQVYDRDRETDNDQQSGGQRQDRWPAELVERPEEGVVLRFGHTVVTERTSCREPASGFACLNMGRSGSLAQYVPVTVKQVHLIFELLVGVGLVSHQ
jgi:hypothetical protein